MILDPVDMDEDLNSEADRIIETLLWNFWPRMMEEVDQGRKIRFRVEVEGQMRPIPQPEHCPPLDLFCRAMSAIRSRDSSVVRLVRCLRPQQDLGRLAITKGLCAKRRLRAREDSLIPQRCHHIALMRPVELVVRYLEGSPLPDERMEWAGVFRASDDDEVEEAFAMAEPPAHDDWIPDSLEKGRQRTFVTVALREIRKAAQENGAADLPTRASTNATPLGELAGHLGRLLAGDPGEGGAPARPPVGAGGVTKRHSLGRPEFIGLEDDAGTTVAVFETHVRRRTNSGPLQLALEPVYVLEGGTVRPQPEEGDIVPEVLSVATDDGELLGTGFSVPLNAAEGRLLIRLRMTGDRAIALNAQLMEE